MTRVLVLRPEPGASATVEKARSRDLDAFAVPLFEIEPVHWDVPEQAGFDGILFTSANAIRHAGQQLGELRGLAAYAVGEATADAARDAGFDIRSTGNDGVDRLLQSIEPDLRLLHLCGEDRKAPSTAPQTIVPVTVYRAKERAADLSQAAGSVVLVHSPRAGRRLADLMENRSDIRVAAISAAAAEAVGGGWQRVEAAKDPSDDALLALATSLCKKPDGE